MTRTENQPEPTRTCPQCGVSYNHFPALSRLDNKTLICNDCGTNEAMADFLGEPPLRQSQLARDIADFKAGR